MVPLAEVRHLWDGLICPPAYGFPDTGPVAADVVVVNEAARLARHFHGWRRGEIAGARSPLVAIVHEGHPVSICCSARASNRAAEAGVETAAAFPGRG
jgi:hypothetical protein